VLHSVAHTKGIKVSDKRDRAMVVWLCARAQIYNDGSAAPEKCTYRYLKKDKK